jgi:porphobilinogen synthase
MVALVHGGERPPEACSRTSLRPTTLDELPQLARAAWRSGLCAIKLFAAGTQRNRLATEATAPDNVMARAIRAVKAAQPAMCVMTETCLCSYTDSGACVIVGEDGKIDIARTHAALSEEAVVHASAGADVVGPAAMVDGSVEAVRRALNDSGYRGVSVMPHLIVDSALYGLYRTIMAAHPRGGRRMFQIGRDQPHQVVDQARAFLDEGADMLLLEPAIFNLDLAATLRRTVGCPIAAFSVSGEYAMLTTSHFAAVQDTKVIMMEAFECLKRSGVDMIVTYAALELANWLQGTASTTSP